MKKYYLTRHARDDKLAAMGIPADQFLKWLARADDPHDVDVKWMSFTKDNKHLKGRGRLLRIMTESGYERYVVILADDDAVITVFNPEARDESRQTTIVERLRTLNRYLDKSDLPTLILAELEAIEQVLESLNARESRQLFGVGSYQYRIPVLKDGIGIFLHYSVGHNISIRNPTPGTKNSFAVGEQVVLVEMVDGKVLISERFLEKKEELQEVKVLPGERKKANRDRKQIRIALAKKSKEIGRSISERQIHRLNEVLQRKKLTGKFVVQFQISNLEGEVVRKLLVDIDSNNRVSNLDLADSELEYVELGRI